MRAPRERPNAAAATTPAPRPTTKPTITVANNPVISLPLSSARIVCASLSAEGGATRIHSQPRKEGQAGYRRSRGGIDRRARRSRKGQRPAAVAGLSPAGRQSAPALSYTFILAAVLRRSKDSTARSGRKSRSIARQRRRQRSAGSGEIAGPACDASRLSRTNRGRERQRCSEHSVLTEFRDRFSPQESGVVVP